MIRYPGDLCPWLQKWTFVLGAQETFVLPWLAFAVDRVGPLSPVAKTVNLFLENGASIEIWVDVGTYGTEPPNRLTGLGDHRFYCRCC